MLAYFVDVRVEVGTDVSNQHVDLVGGALDDAFDRTVRKVVDITGNIMSACQATGGVAKTNPLDLAFENYESLFSVDWHGI